MNVIMCKECGFIIENKESGRFYCENCAKNMEFFKVRAFCGAKPDNDLYKHD
ncbi:MAG: hypothetical protein ACFFKA_14015 [Candidatus Thorarchaeota archaeon]